MENTSPFIAVRYVVPSRSVSQCASSVRRKRGGAHRNDWPQRSVVLMHSSLRLTGSLRHSEKAPTVMITLLNQLETPKRDSYHISADKDSASLDRKQKAVTPQTHALTASTLDAAAVRRSSRLEFSSAQLRRASTLSLILDCWFSALLPVCFD